MDPGSGEELAGLAEAMGVGIFASKAEESAKADGLYHRGEEPGGLAVAFRFREHDSE